METNILEFLEKDLVKIEKKMSRAIDEDNFGTYKNLLDATDRILKMLNQYGNEYKQMWSKYRDENGIQHVSVWKQNKDNDIKEHYDFTVKDTYIKESDLHIVSKEEFIKNIQDYNKEQPKNNLVYAECFYSGIRYSLKYFYKDEVQEYYTDNINDFINIIKSYFVHNKADIVVNARGMGTSLCDKLTEENIQYKKIFAKNLIK